jgi:hypothetical protein
VSISLEDKEFKALALLERFDTDYTLHRLDGVYYCEIGPEYGMEMQIMSREAQGTGTSLASAIHNAIQDLGSKGRWREAEERAKGKHSDLCIGGDMGPCNCGAVEREWSLLEK